MIDKYRDKLDEKGVLPVIRVILLVAVTVALVALATVIVFDIGSDVSDTADASVQMEQTDSGVQATIVHNENVDEFSLRHEDGTEQRSTESIGSFTYDNGYGEYTLIGVVGGNEEVIRSTTVVGAESGETLSGTAEIYSLIVGATVEAYDAGGTLVDSTTTDANGQYELTVADASSARIVLNTEGDINYNGEPLHASAEQSGFSAGDTVNFNFDETTATSGISVNGESVTVVSALEGESSSVIEVGNLAQLQAMQGDLDADYKLIRDIDASETETWNEKTFDPVGTYDYFEQANTEFTGSFDGQNHTISNLSINRLDDNYVGLFGAIGAGGEVKNVGVINVNITGEEEVGGLVGFNYKGTVSNSYSTGNVTGESYSVGGLVGFNYKGTVSNSYSTGNVTGESYSVGGLVGDNEGTVSNSYSTGNVTGESDYVGGLVGTNEGTVSNSYSTGNVTGEEEVGGLVGISNGNISNSYSTGNVTGNKRVGGLIGYNREGTVSNSYSTGSVSGDYYVGGLVGISNGNISNSYWDTEATGQSSSAGLPDSNGLTTSEMQGSSASTEMIGFDFTDTWSTVEGDYPELQWQEYRADVKFFIVLLWYTVMCFLISGIILMEKRR
jgi:FlaG/FlaF family flagellin (archaellin)